MLVGNELSGMIDKWIGARRTLQAWASLFLPQHSHVQHNRQWPYCQDCRIHTRNWRLSCSEPFPIFPKVSGKIRFQNGSLRQIFCATSPPKPDQVRWITTVNLGGLPQFLCTSCHHPSKLERDRRPSHNPIFHDNVRLKSFQISILRLRLVSPMLFGWNSGEGLEGCPSVHQPCAVAMPTWLLSKEVWERKRERML